MLAIADASYDIRFAMQRFFQGDKTELVNSTSLMFKMLGEKAVYCGAFPQKIEQYSYYSPKGTPMYSSFFQLKTPRSVYGEVKRTVRFWHNCLMARVKSAKKESKDKGRFLYRDKSMQYELRRPPVNSDNFVYSLDNQIVDSIRVKIFESDILKAMDLYDDQIWEEEFKQREPIE